MPNVQNLNDYRGDPNLAGGTAGNTAALLPYDFKNVNDAVQRMAAYQYDENKTRWAQANLMAEQLGKQAADAQTYKFGDMLPADSEAIIKALNDQNTFYAEHPDATMLRTDPKTGKIINDDLHKQWVQLGNAVNGAIANGNTRKAAYDQLINQGSTIADQNEKENWTEWARQRYQSPTNENILLYPTYVPYDINKFVPEQLSADKDAVYGNYIKSTGLKAADIPLKVTQGLADMQTNDKMSHFFAHAADTYNTMLQKAMNNHQQPDATGLTWATASPQQRTQWVQQEGGEGADNLVTLLNAYNAQKAFWEKKQIPTEINGVPNRSLQDVSGEQMGGIDLSKPLTTQDVLGLYAAAKAPPISTAEKVTWTGAADENARAAARLAQEERHWQSDQMKEKQPGLMKAQAITSIFGQLNNPDAKRDDYGIKIDLSNPLMNAFKQSLGSTEITIPKYEVDPNDSSKTIQTGITTKKVDDLKISNIRLVPDPNDRTNPNKAKLRVWYWDPSNPANKDGSPHHSEAPVDYDLPTTWTAMDNMWGPNSAEKVATSGGQILAMTGDVQPDINHLYPLLTGDQFTGQVTEGTPPPLPLVTNPTTGRAQIDPSKLTKNDPYTYNGEILIWNGKNLVKPPVGWKYQTPKKTIPKISTNTTETKKSSGGSNYAGGRQSGATQ